MKIIEKARKKRFYNRLNKKWRGLIVGIRWKKDKFKVIKLPKTDKITKEAVYTNWIMLEDGKFYVHNHGQAVLIVEREQLVFVEEVN